MPLYRQATADDFLVLTSSSFLGTTVGGNPLLINGVSVPLADNWVLTPEEQANIQTAVDAYNVTIQSVGSANGLAVVNLDGLLTDAANGGTQFDDFTMTTSLVFGGMVSLDGVHLTSRGYALMANKMLEEGLFDAPPMYQIVMGTRWGLPATPETLIYMKSLLPKGAVWAAFGIARMQMPMVAQAALLGGNVRVGLEDNLYLSRGVFATNGQLVEKAKSIIEGIGLEVATPDEAREIMGLSQ